MKNFSKNSNLDEAVTFLLDLSSRTDLKLNNNLVTPELAKKVIKSTLIPQKHLFLIAFQWWLWRNVSLNLPHNTSTSLRVCKNRIFHIAEGVICDPCIKKMLGRDLCLKTIAFFFRLVNSLKYLLLSPEYNCWSPEAIWPEFQYDFRSSQSAADLLTVVFDRIDWAFNMYWANWAVVLDISKAFYKKSPSGLLHELESMKF